MSKFNSHRTPVKQPLTWDVYKEIAELCREGETVFAAIKVFRNKLGVTFLGGRSYYETIMEIYELSEINDPREFVDLLRLEILFG